MEQKVETLLSTLNIPVSGYKGSILSLLEDNSTQPYQKQSKRINALSELCNIVNNEKQSWSNKTLISSPKDVFYVMKPIVGNLDHEELWALFLNRGNKLISKMMMSKGGVSTTIADNRLICREAIMNLASAIIIVHNHPSGSPIPGNEDKKVTSKLKEVCNMLDITFTDHVVISGEKYYSFADEGCLL